MWKHKKQLKNDTPLYVFYFKTSTNEHKQNFTLFVSDMWMLLMGEI